MRWHVVACVAALGFIGKMLLICDMIYSDGFWARRELRPELRHAAAWTALSKLY